jgi:hypothetical protein
MFGELFTMNNNLSMIICYRFFFRQNNHLLSFSLADDRLFSCASTTVGALDAIGDM